MRFLERSFSIHTFPSLLSGQWFAQVHNSAKTLVVHETGVYSSAKWAEHAALEWAKTSQSRKASLLDD